MNGRRIAIALLLGGIVLQWTLPVYLIRRGQAALDEGALYRFRTAPVDPVDPFRGRYVVLDFVAATLTLPRAAERYDDGERGYAPIRVGADGFALLDPPLPQPPAGDYLQVRVAWAGEGELRLQLPFDRYYLDEHLAPEAEQRYRDSNRVDAESAEDARPAWVQVRVRDGYALIEELYLDGQPVRELLRPATASP